MWHFSMVHKWHFSNIIWWEAAIKMSPISSLSRLGICLLFLYQQRFLPKLCLCVSGFQQQYTWTAGNTVWPHTMLSYTTAFGTQFGTFSFYRKIPISFQLHFPFLSVVANNHRDKLNTWHFPMRKAHPLTRLGAHPVCTAHSHSPDQLDSFLPLSSSLFATINKTLNGNSPLAWGYGCCCK